MYRRSNNSDERSRCGHSSRLFRTAVAVVGLVLSTVGAGCTLDFDQFEAAEDAPTAETGVPETGTDGGDARDAVGDTGDDTRRDTVSPDTTVRDVGGETCPGDGDGCSTPCTCPVARDECTSDRRRCYRKGWNCGSGRQCPDGYTCRESRCVCTNVDKCGRSCNRDAQCPAGLTCDEDTSRCRDPKPKCVTDESCAKDEYCGRFHGEGGGCKSRGSKTARESCSNNADCKSGLCVNDECAKLCTGSGDCGALRSCGNPLSSPLLASARMACVRPGHGAFQCTSDEEVHYSSPFLSDDCVKEWCYVGDDCPDGDCEIRAKLDARSALPTCNDSSKLCRSNELRVVDERAAQKVEFCAIHAFCWTAANCPGSYKCKNLPWRFGTFFGWDKICARTP